MEEGQLETQVLDHLGLVMSVIKKLGIIQEIDKLLPVSLEKGAKITMGERVSAMLLNALGFIDDRLYMFSEFLENKPVERLFREGVQAKDFTDDALGRCLDAIYEYGPTKLFSQIAFKIGTEHNLLGRTARFDTTSLTLYGNYEQEEDEKQEVEQAEAAEQKATEELAGLAEIENEKMEPMEDSQVEGQKDKEKEVDGPSSTNREKVYPAYGYSKDGRGDLKQMVLTLATTGKANLPIWSSAHAGNAADKIVLQQAAERMENFSKALDQSPSFIYVGDSAMYEKCVEKGKNMGWLSRVPYTLKKAKQVVTYSNEDLDFINLEKEYKVSKSLEVDYKGVKQRWVVVYSGQMYKRARHTLDKKISQELEQISKKAWHISNQVYGCQKDAYQAIQPISRKLKYHHLTYQVVAEYSHTKAGRPKAGALKELVGYKVETKLELDPEKVKKEEQELGKFILATNQLDASQLEGESMLHEYKQQMHTEKGFRFIKSNAFEVSSVFLKKSSRIEALMMIMTLTLMVYNLTAYFLHQELNDKQESIPNQVKKETQKPSLAYVFRKFHGVQVVRINVGNQIKSMVSNMNSILKLIVRCFGPIAQNIYGLVP
nr:IS1634 family transposase [Microcystis sp. M59BS1]